MFTSAKVDARIICMDTTAIRAGTRVIITDAEGREYEVEALSGIEHKGHAFPLVWVNRPLSSGDFEPMPWPADSVREVVDA
jgi:hypothetical protein